MSATDCVSVLNQGRGGYAFDLSDTAILRGLHPHPSVPGDGLDGAHHSDRRLRGLLAATSDAVYRMNPDWTLMYQLDGHGFLADTTVPSVAWQEEYLFEEDRPEVMTAAEEAIRTGSVFQLEHRVRRADGTVGWIYCRAIPIADDSGEIVEWFGAASDITDRREKEELTKLLTLEVHHRLKNLLSVVQAVAHGTFKSDGSREELKTFEARLGALGSAQNALTKTETKGADVGAVLMLAMAAMPDSRIALDGPPALLGADEAFALALALHELCTNAIKYGALSGPTGRIDVRWSIEDTLLRLEWRESGGKPVTPPTHRGFGSRILKSIIPRGRGGSLNLDFAPEGLVCRMSLPLVTPA